ncbi:hypothetical protein KP509_02G039500 [Ceratopteris richardii]|uniref:Uncharacterized protein n=1 Tax=Ceratopteris richardii TaxID=49495 RepID=A0A8T2V4W5_CERRI|nr:hypothetical protein KP509_02G039500 [Ceratopteris richardii]
MVEAVVVGRAVFGLLGLVQLVTVVYTLITDGSPFRMELLTRWMVATLIDFYINMVPIAAWVFYKESSWIKGFIWAVLLVCFGSITSCWYITWKLFQLSTQDPIYMVLLRDPHSREEKKKGKK